MSSAVTPTQPSQTSPKVPDPRPPAKDASGDARLSPFALLRAFGPTDFVRRAFYLAQIRTGWLRRRFPASDLARWIPSDAVAIANRIKTQGLAFLPSSSEIRTQYRERFPELAEGVQKRGDRALRGEFEYFSGRSYRFEAGVPDWMLNPLTGQRADPQRHWSESGFYSPQQGDLKFQLEPARFAFAYDLARAYAWAGDEKYSECFWRLFESFAEENPPQAGPLWVCAQECSFRVMAWTFALGVFAGASNTTVERIGRLLGLIAAHGDRIEGTLAYARSQKNNHAVSEAAALWTIGLVFPELPKAQRWRYIGRRGLESEARRQIYDDGSYVQYSFNYHRVMLHDFLWAAALGEAYGQKLSPELYSRVGRAADFLYQMMDPDTGGVPNTGGNDGALILPLNESGYSDFRGAVQAGHYLARRSQLLAEGPWNEDLFWLFGMNAAARAQAQVVRPRSFSAVNGGYETLRGGRAWGMLRCSEYHDRPAQADQLHFDLWWRGVNIALDAGTFAYSGEYPWRNGLAGTSVHNTVCVNHADQMRRAGQFLWLDWAQGKVRSRGKCALGDYIEAEHDGYRRFGVTHRRTVVRHSDDVWIVIDDLNGDGTSRLQWLFPDYPYSPREDGDVVLHTTAGDMQITMRCSTAAQIDLVRAGRCEIGTADERDLEIRGWHSPTYGVKQPALSFGLSAECTLPVRFITVFQSAGDRVQIDRELMAIGISTDAGTVRSTLSAPGSESALSIPFAKRGGRILLIHQAFAGPDDPGGTRHYELARHLLGRGFRFTVVASRVSYLSGQTTSNTRENIDGIEIRRAKTLEGLHRNYIWRVAVFFSFMASSVVEGLRSGPADVVLGTTPQIFQAVSAWVVSVLRRSKFVLEVRDLWPEFAIEVGVLKNPMLIRASRWLEAFLYRRADHIVVNSPAFREYLIQRKQIADKKISVIPNGVDPDMFNPESSSSAVRDRFNFSGKFVVTYAGALGLANDIETIFRAAARLRDDNDIRFLLVGDGKMREHLQRLAAEDHLANVTFAGPQSKRAMPEFLAASDAFVATLKDIPMFRTTYPNKVFDYMAAARPTILGIDGVIREVLEAGRGGIFVPPGDDKALADAVMWLKVHPAEAREMGRSARLYVEQNFRRDRQADEFADVLERVMGASG